MPASNQRDIFKPIAMAATPALSHTRASRQLTIHIVRDDSLREFMIY